MERRDRPITSREYKLLLYPEKFRKRKKGAKEFWARIESLIDGKVVKRQKKELVRRTWYADTAQMTLHEHGFALRLREEMSLKPKYKITLKYRGVDRCASGSHDMSVSKTVTEQIASEGGQAEIEWKFEEDILPPFFSKFAHSVSIKTDDPPELENMQDLLQVFPGLGVLAIPESTPVYTVNGRYFHEVARYLGQVQFGGKLRAKFCLSFWYRPDEEDAPARVAEFSFDYDVPEGKAEDQDRLERFPFHVVEGSNSLFRALQKKSKWVHFDGTTKTAYAYDAN